MAFAYLVAVFLVGSVEPQVPSDPTRISSLVRGADGKPLKGATVYILAARARVGQSQLCPTCYPGCRRKATTGDDGGAVISGVDRNLVFTVVAVLEGYSPVLKESDDLLGDTLVFDLTRPDPKRLAEGHAVRGLVVGPDGLPVKGAVVRPFGAKHDGHQWQGRVDKTDTIAVTDLKGEFTLTTGLRGAAFDLVVEALDLASGIFLLVPTGKDRQTLRLTAGVTIRGRVVREGQPVPSASVYLAQDDYRVEFTFRPKRVVTNASGEFVFPHVREDDSYAIYGTMEDAGKLGWMPSTAHVKVPKTGGDPKAIELAARPVHRLSGRVIPTGDGKLEPGMRLYLTRDKVPDASLVSIGKDGSFAFTGVPGERIELDLWAEKSCFSEANVSRNPTIGRRLVGVGGPGTDNLLLEVQPGDGLLPKEPFQTPRDRAAFQERVRRFRDGVTMPLKGVDSK